MSEGTTDREQVWLAALAGLLHDIGKFTGRAGVGTAIDDKREQKEIGYWHAEHSQTFVDHYVPAKFRAGVGVVRYHHRPGNVPAESVEVQALCKLVRLADWWSAGERTTGMPERSTASHTPLLPVLSRVQLVREPAEEGRWKHRVQACGLSKESLFPVDTKENPLGDVSAQYEDLWDKVVYPELDAWKGRENWETQSLESYFTTLLALLQKHLTFVPSATPWQADEDDRVIPDVSLFDHLRITAALAACLRAGFSDEEILTFGEQENRPVALLVRGDFSGIQSFIYRITRPDNERTFREAARRLRGRSFYLTLLGEIIAHQLLEWLGLPPTNLLFCGGGRFDILVPRNAQETIETAQKQLEDWLLREFHGELAMVVAWEPVSPQDMANMRKVYLTLEARLDELKERKWQRFLTSPDFFVSTKDEWEACPVCKLQATAGICSQCDLQARIGRLLPQVDYLVVTSSQPTWKDQEAEVLTVPFDFGDGPIYAALLTARAAKLLPTLTSGTVYRLNDTDFLCEAWPHLGQGFRFLANTVPHVLGEGEQLVLPGRSSEEAVGPGEGLDFEEIAYLSTGSKKLGVLKADVDHLGLLFSEGLEPLTISRLAALSGAIDRFFSGYINVLADAVSNEWKTHDGRKHPWCGKVSGLFYVTYSGGDDLLIIGPWDAVMALARRLEADWRAYACENPDVTLSAGIVLVKPHHPIQRMAIVVNAAEKRAKNDGRRRIHIFAQNVLWQPDGPEPGFGQILDYARGLADAVGEQELPRSFIHYVGRLYDEHFIRKAVNGKPNLMFLPKLYYAVKRRVRKEVAESLGLMDMLWKRKMMWYAPVLVSYVSLITRKE